jgi:putative heme iron utilization protein
MANPDSAIVLEARRLLRAARSATLATAKDGQPFASLVTPAVLPDLSVLLLLSSLSEHTGQLQAERRCALLVTGAADGPNPQTTPRLSLTGLAETIEDAALKARWLAVHPYAALYAGFTDFSLWRIRPAGFLFVGGFGRAARLRREVMLPDPEAVAAVAAAEARILAHCNADHAADLDRLVQRHGGEGAGWRMVAADVDGCDLALDETVLRVAWPTPVADAAGVRAALVALLQ